MMFAYKAKLASGALTEGVLEAVDARTAMAQLRSQRLNIIEVAPAKEGGVFGVLKNLNPFKPKVGSKDLVIFSRQLSTLVAAGVPIVQGLSMMGAQIENKRFKEVVQGLVQDIESGMAINESLKKYPDAFSDLYVAMIRAGELGGVLDVILERLSAYLESAEELKHKVKSAMIYPGVMAGIAVGVTAFLMIAIIPKFKDIFESFGADLPMPTKVLLGMSATMTKHFYVLIIIPVGIWQGLKRAYKIEQYAYKLDEIALKLPIFGDILRKVAIAKFCRTLATMIKSGVNIVEALETVAKASGNKVIERFIMESKKSIQEGMRLVEPLKKSKVFPAMVVQMIAIGEESGNLDSMLSKIADFYDGEVDSAVKGLTSMIEPLVIVFMGLVIGGIVIAMFLPMFQISQLAGDVGE
ncbi:MAG: type II secretion system F family protein [Elusimicrobia bacterium]|nr:type II secretion system F family protein [Elusimicrobiota bacterium]